MKLGFDLTIEQSQKLTMTPDLIQAIQILQLNAQELETYIEEQLLANPVLEAEATDGFSESAGETEGFKAAETRGAARTDEAEADFETPARSREDERPAGQEIDWAEYLREREFDDISYRAESAYERSDDPYGAVALDETGLTEHLLFQLTLAELPERCRKTGRYLIESLDANGYMTQTPEEIAGELNVSRAHIERVIETVQGFDPAGVCARDLKECILIQLDRLGLNTAKTGRVVSEHLEDLANNRIGVIAKATGFPVKEVQRIGDLIKTLEPKPGRTFGSAWDTKYIIPDVTVEKVDGEYIVTVNESGLPKLTVSAYYRRMLREAGKDSEISQFLTGKLNSALWLIKSIEQRRRTIYNVVSAVVAYQNDFFEKGPKCLRTLTLKQIADEVGVHESTVSRSVNGKYIQSPRGMFEIKYFFMSGVNSENGEGIASESVKTLIREIVESEDNSAPLSDQAIAETLTGRGIDISRRTVAKYRGDMRLPASSKRKRY